MEIMSTGLLDDSIKWEDLSNLAWEVRQNAFLIGNTAVGAALVTGSGTTFVGCNVEHRFRCHDVHAEVNAITAMVSAGETDLTAILIVAERSRFTPCGGCLDWIFQFGGPDCLVGYQNSPNSSIILRSARELMPFYPE